MKPADRRHEQRLQRAAFFLSRAQVDGRIHTPHKPHQHKNIRQKPSDALSHFLSHRRDVVALDLHGIHDLSVERKPLESVIHELIFVVPNQTGQARARLVQVLGRIEIEVNPTRLQIRDSRVELRVKANRRIQAVGLNQSADLVLAHIFPNLQIPALEQGIAERSCIAVRDQRHRERFRLGLLRLPHRHRAHERDQHRKQQHRQDDHHHHRPPVAGNVLELFFENRQNGFHNDLS